MGLLGREKRYNEARKQLELFLEKYPKHKLAQNVPYWIGETYYVQKKYAKASEQFLHSYQKHPKGTKAPDSLLKLGLSLLNMKQKEGACGAFQEMQDKFPKADKPLLRRAAKETKGAKCN